MVQLAFPIFGKNLVGGKKNQSRVEEGPKSPNATAINWDNHFPLITTNWDNHFTLFTTEEKSYSAELAEVE